MGRKRKREDSEERIYRKIRRLEEKLKRHRSEMLYSFEEDTNSPRQTPARDLSPEEAQACSNEVYAFPLSPTPPPEVTAVRPPMPPQAETLSQAPPLSPANNVPADEAIAGTSIDAADAVEPGDVDLADDILQLLGDAPEPETTFGASVHKDIAMRWHDVLKKGLSKDSKEKIFKEYLIPSNCELLVPPILNPEAKAALTDALVKRDASMHHRQKHLSVAVAALTHALEKIISKKDSQTYILKPISDACRILCDMHHFESETRKKFVISSTNYSLKDALINASTDKYLFGENMGERLKTAKTVQKSGAELKSIQKSQNLKNPPFHKNRGNYKTLHQKRPEAGRTPAGPRQQWTYPRGRMSGRTTHLQAPPPPPPPPPPYPPRRAGRR